MSIEVKKPSAKPVVLPAKIQSRAAAEQALMEPDHPMRVAFSGRESRVVKERSSWFRTPRLAAFRARRALVNESGAATAEYAVATMAAVAFAGVLVVIMRSDEVRGILTDLVRRALTVD